MYKVIHSFYDLQDENRGYLPGDIYPREGLPVSAERLQELSTDKNRRGFPVIEKVDTAETVAGQGTKTRKRVKKDAD